MVKIRRLMDLSSSYILLILTYNLPATVVEVNEKTHDFFTLTVYCSTPHCVPYGRKVWLRTVQGIAILGNM